MAVSEEEWKNRCNKLGYTLISFGGTGKSSSTVKCSKCKVVKDTRLTNLQSGYKPCKCSKNYRPSSGEKIEKVCIKSATLGLTATLSECGKYVNLFYKCGHSKIVKYTDFLNRASDRCLECWENNVERVLETVPDGFIICLDNLGAHQDNVYKCLLHDELVYKNKYNIISSGCTTCSSLNRSGSQKTPLPVTKVKLFLADTDGYSFDWSTYQCSDKKMEMLCPKGHLCKITPCKFYIGRRCPDCSKYGFKQYKEAYFYLFRWKGRGLDFLKYGITNREYKDRILSQARLSGLHYNKILTYKFLEGCDALFVERYCREVIGKNHIDKRDFPDGYTETIPYCESSIEKIKEMVEWVKKK